MLACHATWGPDRRLHVWAEDADAYDAQPRLRRSSAARASTRAPRVAETARHPFVADHVALEGLLRTMLGAVEPAGKRTVLELTLPTAHGTPLPSPQLPVTPRDEGSEPTLVAWRVATRALDGVAAGPLLLALAEAPDASSATASLRFWTLVARLALEVVARGRVVPAIHEQLPGDWRVTWDPVPGAGDASRLRALGRVMPGVCRAAGSNGTATSSEGVLTAALSAFADGIVRGALAGTEAADLAGASSRPFLRALAGPDPSLAEPADARRGLAQALGDWRARALPTEAPVRTLFRLVEPGHDLRDSVAGDVEADVPTIVIAPPEPWRLEVLVGPRSEPSLLIPAAVAWDQPGLLGRVVPGEDVEETLLVDLARAARLFPPLEAALSAAQPVGVELDTPGAHAFLREGAPLLADAGFGVLLPSWWRSSRRRIGLRVRARGRPSRTRGTSALGIGQEAIVEYELAAALGDATLTESELRAIARLKAPLVQVRGEWVEAPPDEIAAALRAVSGAAGGGARTMTVGDFLLGGARLPADLPLVSYEVTGWLERLLAEEGSLRVEPLATPPGFGGQLRPYQERGLGWLAFHDRLGLGACLADDMGLGKTAQLLALLVAERADSGRDQRGVATPAGAAVPDRVGKGASAVGPDRVAPTLVVCPMSVVGNWQKEAARFAPALRVHVHHGAERLAGEALQAVADDADLVLTTYAVVTRDADALAAISWGRVVLDEAQAIKNADTLQARAARRLSARTRVALTGTPVENRLAELWSIMDFLNPGLLGSERSFRDRYAVPVEVNRDAEAASRLRRLTAPFILRRTKTDRSIAPELPDKLEMVVPCNLTREQATLYKAVVDDMLERIDRSEGIQRRGLVLTAIGRLKQVCNHPAQALGDGSPLRDRSGKLARLEEVLEETLEAGDRTLIFTQYTEWAERLRPYLRERFGREVLYLHGGTSRLARDGMVERFQAGRAPIFILSLRAGGSGINLTAANQVIHFDRWWNPAVEDQASDRAYRIGQTRDVQVRKFVCSGTIEERIAEMSEAKRELASRIVGEGEAWIGDLSTTELRELMELSPDAVSER